MQKVRSIVLVAFFAFLFAFVVSALEVKKSEIVITTDPYQNMSVTIIDGDTNQNLQTFEGRARKFGEYRFTYYGTISKIFVSASIVNNDTDEVLLTKKFGPYTLGTSPINVTLALDAPEEPIITESEVESTNLSASVTNDTAKEKSSILGFVTGTIGDFSPMYYYIGAAVIAAAVVLLVLRRKGILFPDSPFEPNPKNLKADKRVPSKTEVVVPAQTTNQVSINETEKRISDIQKQLKDIENEEKLLKLQRQLNKEKNELKKLQAEDEPIVGSGPNDQDIKKF